MKCEKCKNESVENKVRDNCEQVGSVCEEVPVTQFDNLIEYDSNKYILSILTMKEYDKKILKDVSDICSCNMLQAKKILEETGMSFKPMDALDMRALKRRVEATGILYEITPGFMWK